MKCFQNIFKKKVTTIRSTIKVKSSEINFATNVNTNKDSQLYEISEFSPLSIAELASIISCINNKSCCYDLSPVNLIKQCSDITFPILQLIINKSFKEAKVPYQLKRANVSPITKNKDLDPDNLKNYRPISNIPFVASSSSSSSSFEEVSTPARHKQDWGRGFILLLPQTAALPGSDAGSDVIKPASSFVIQNRQTSCSMWCPMYRARC